MMDQLVIHGMRGTQPVCGREFLRYGGDTTCLSIASKAGMLVIDAGTGLRHVSRLMEGRSPLPPITVLLTHLHMDHLIGLPSFGPLYSEEADLRFMADPRRGDNWRHALAAFMRRPYWPVGLSEANAAITYVDLPISQGFLDIYGLRVSWLAVPHPQHCLAYRIDAPQQSFVVATDTEYADGQPDPEFIAFCRGADWLVFDAHFTPEELPAFRGWGHSSWRGGCDAALAAGVPGLVLTHHAPSRTDEAMDRILDAASAAFPGILAATPNLCLGPSGSLV